MTLRAPPRKWPLLRRALCGARFRSGLAAVDPGGGRGGLPQSEKDSLTGSLTQAGKRRRAIGEESLGRPSGCPFAILRLSGRGLAFAQRRAGISPLGGVARAGRA